MLTQEQIQKFHHDGFLLIKDVFTSDEIESLRRYTETVYLTNSPYPGDTDCAPGNASLRANFLSRYPQYIWLLRHDGFISILKSILEDDFVFLPEMALQASGYGRWHKDTSSQEAHGHLFHYEPDFLMIEAAIYLQPNDETGGGLDVVPGSHTKPDMQSIKLSLFKRILRRLGLYKSPDRNGYSIPNNEGDLVLFDFRIDHQATQPVKAIKKTKYAMFFACSKNNRHVSEYIRFIRSRKGYDYLNDDPIYSEELIKLAEEECLSLPLS